MLVGSMTFSSSLPIWRRVAVRDLAVAHDAIERRTHFGALELLASRDDTRVRRFTITLRGIATVLGILELLGGAPHRSVRSVDMRWNWRSACSYVCTAAFSGGGRRREAVTNRRCHRGARAGRPSLPDRHFP